MRARIVTQDSDQHLPAEAPSLPKKKFEVKVKRPSSGCPRTLRVNLENCKYDIVRQVADRLDFKEVKDETEVWDLYWTDLSVSVERVSKMLPFQRINHFPGMLDICRKAPLSRHLKRMQERFPDEYNFFPQSWAIPAEVDEWRLATRRRAASSTPLTFIMKPDAGAMGRGIHLVQKEEDFDFGLGEFNGWVLQAYVERPLLIDDYKFDLRIYVLVKSVDPLVIYLLEEGLARFATVKYTPPSAANLQIRNMHLTNYSVNKTSDQYVFAEGDPNTGSKRRLSAVLKLLRERGHDTEALMSRVEQLVVKTILPIQPQLAHTYYMACSRTTHASGASAASRCFELLGFDVLLDENLQPWLMEVNHSPSFGTDTLLDEEIKGNAIRDIVRSLGLSAAKRQRMLGRQRRRQRERLYGPADTGAHRWQSPLWRPQRHRGTSQQQRLQLIQPHHSQQQQQQQQHHLQQAGLDTSSDEEEGGGEDAPAAPEARLGGFHCIYPLKGNGERLAAMADWVLAEWETRNECVCERCSQRHYAQMAQAAMLTFHHSALKMAAQREREQSARFRSAAPSPAASASASASTSTSHLDQKWSKADAQLTSYRVGTLASVLGQRRQPSRSESMHDLFREQRVLERELSHLHSGYTSPRMPSPLTSSAGSGSPTESRSGRAGSSRSMPASRRPAVRPAPKPPVPVHSGSIRSPLKTLSDAEDRESCHGDRGEMPGQRNPNRKLRGSGGGGSTRPMSGNRASGPGLSSRSPNARIGNGTSDGLRGPSLQPRVGIQTPHQQHTPSGAAGHVTTATTRMPDTGIGRSANHVGRSGRRLFSSGDI